jgi:hypothetical protein
VAHRNRRSTGFLDIDAQRAARAGTPEPEPSGDESPEATANRPTYAVEPSGNDRWACCWGPEEGACGATGSLHDRPARFLRHVCYGHGERIRFDGQPAIYYVCDKHVADFQRVHGLEGEPDWLRRERITREYQRSQWPSRTDTVITSVVGNGNG